MVSAAQATRTQLDPAEALRLPPHSEEAERSLLGGLMLDNSTWDTIADIITEDDFYRHDHRLIFHAISELAERNDPLDAVTLSEFLANAAMLDDAGGLAYLGGLAKDTPSAANIKAYAEIVRERSILRHLIRVGGEIATSGHTTEGRTASELLDNAERKVFEIAERGKRIGAGFVPLKKLLPAAIDRLDTLHSTEGDITGVSTGFDALDKLTAGLQKGDLIVIAGRPSMGKTSLALNIAENAAIGDKIPTALFSMEPILFYL